MSLKPVLHGWSTWQMRDHVQNVELHWAWLNAQQGPICNVPHRLSIWNGHL